MRTSSVFSAIVLGLATVNAIPSKLDTLNYRDDTSALERRVPKPAAPAMTTVGSNNCLNVPMLYMAFMETSTGKYERYQCDSGAIPIRTTGTVAAVADRQMATKELLLCMDINIVSKKGVIKTHIPPTVCPALKGYKGTDRASSGATQDYLALKEAGRSLVAAHLAAISPFTVVVVHGPSNAFTDEETKLTLTDMFGIPSSQITLQAESQSASGSTTRIDLNPTQLFIDEKDAKITVP